MKAIFKYTCFALLIFILLWILLVARIYINSLSNDKQNVDAIVVLGASQWNGRPSPALKARLDHALSIYNEGYAEFIVLTGGIAEGDTISESRVGKTYLVNKGVPKSKILIEEKGRTTKESLKNVSEIIKRNNLKKILFVSHGYHIHRVKKIAKDLEMKNSLASAVEIRDKEKKFKYILKESFIFVIYLFNPEYSHSD